MPRQLRKLIYSSEDWSLMQSALLNATKKLNRDQGHEAGESRRWREVRSRLSYEIR